MVELKRRSVPRRSKKCAVPLSNLRTSQVVRTVVDHPRRLEELLNLLQDKSRVVRGRAGATLARLSESHPGRLVRTLDRIKNALADESAYVRWHLVYTLGQIGSSVPQTLPSLLKEMASALGDDNGIVRGVAIKGLKRIIARKAEPVAEYFESSKQEPPAAIVHALKKSGLILRVTPQK